LRGLEIKIMLQLYYEIGQKSYWMLEPNTEVKVPWGGTLERGG